MAGYDMVGAFVEGGVALAYLARDGVEHYASGRHRRNDASARGGRAGDVHIINRAGHVHQGQAERARKNHCFGIHVVMLSVVVCVVAVVCYFG